MYSALRSVVTISRTSGMVFRLRGPEPDSRIAASHFTQSMCRSKQRRWEDGFAIISLLHCVTSNLQAGCRRSDFQRVDAVLLQQLDQEIRMSGRDRVVLSAVKQFFKSVGAGR